jgi:diguanylate cyclase (GGDEF)-like protein
MNSLDPRTIVFLTGIMTGLMSLVLFFLRRNFPSSIKGLGEWAVSPFILFAAAALVGLRGRAPELITFVVPYVLLPVGIYVTYLGSQRFFGVTPAVHRWLAVLPIIAAFAYWFTLVAPNAQLRIMLMSLLLGVVFALHAHLIYRQAPRSFSSWLGLSVLLCAIAIQVLRLVTAWERPHDTSAFDPSSPQSTYIASGAFVVLLFNISLVLMATDRLRLEFEHLASHDSLTNAFTRRYMNDAFQRELERCRRHGHVTSLLLIDIDHFKEINDSYGHQHGDKVLIEFVAQVEALLRRPDQLGRFGGEEFMLLLPETPLNEALVVAERIRAMVEQSRATPRFTISIGVTSRRDDTDTLDTMLSRADAALYQAKAKGRNRVEST